MFLRLFASSCILLFASSQEAIAANKILSYDFNEGSGSTVINSGLANNANGTIEGASYLPDNRTGSDWVLNFNGVDSVEIPNYVNPSDLITVEAWINPDEEDESVLFNNGLHIIWDDGYPGVRLALVHHQLLFTVAMTPNTGGINQIQVMGGITCSGHWQHVAGIYDGASARIYINGKEIARNSNSTSSPGSGGIQNAYIGSNSLTSIFGFHGKIDDLHVWDRALTADELAAGQANTGECGGEINQPPVANAGIDQETEIDFDEANYANIILDGSGSFDPDLGPNPLSYHWTHIDSPDIIPESNSALTNFTITEPGIYSFSLVVNDGLAASSPDLVTYIIHESCESACSNTDSQCSINYLGCFF
ncbi:LamG domain-containing protein [Methylocucumis oryzae]|uniref:LamG domain-containing protein n=1 Tax=Methylocucumis oryzae TaxID=1632867 RepID=UPI0012FEA44D|nr:LamG domain-containing protein [Methylocucumis oryzae]